MANQTPPQTWRCTKRCSCGATVTESSTDSQAQADSKALAALKDHYDRSHK